MPVQPLNNFINDPALNNVTLEEFCLLDDYDVMSAIKNWSTHHDKVLSIFMQRHY